ADPTRRNRWSLAPEQLASQTGNIHLSALLRGVRRGGSDPASSSALRKARRHPDGIGILSEDLLADGCFFGFETSESLRHAANMAAGQKVLGPKDLATSRRMSGGSSSSTSTPNSSADDNSKSDKHRTNEPTSKGQPTNKQQADNKQTIQQQPQTTGSPSTSNSPSGSRPLWWQQQTNKQQAGNLQNIKQHPQTTDSPSTSSSPSGSIFLSESEPDWPPSGSRPLPETDPHGPLVEAAIARLDAALGPLAGLRVESLPSWPRDDSLAGQELWRRAPGGGSVRGFIFYEPPGQVSFDAPGHWGALRL
ncbi:unnamed protein product, partial [Polarella glacialis]